MPIAALCCLVIGRCRSSGWRRWGLLCKCPVNEKGCESGFGYFTDWLGIIWLRKPRREGFLTFSATLTPASGGGCMSETVEPDDMVKAAMKTNPTTPPFRPRRCSTQHWSHYQNSRRLSCCITKFMMFSPSIYACCWENNLPFSRLSPSLSPYAAALPGRPP
jgi:hypothetical protein